METWLVSFVYRTPSRKKGSVTTSTGPIYRVCLLNEEHPLVIHTSHIPLVCVPCEPCGSAVTWRKCERRLCATWHKLCRGTAMTHLCATWRKCENWLICTHSYDSIVDSYELTNLHEMTHMRWLICTTQMLWDITQSHALWDINMTHLHEPCCHHDTRH